MGSFLTLILSLIQNWILTDLCTWKHFQIYFLQLEVANSLSILVLQMLNLSFFISASKLATSILSTFLSYNTSPNVAKNNQHSTCFTAFSPRDTSVLGKWYAFPVVIGKDFTYCFAIAYLVTAASFLVPLAPKPMEHILCFLLWQDPASMYQLFYREKQN